MPKFFMMCGLPASGKSTYAKTLATTCDAKVHSSDRLRKELFGDENVNDRNGELFSELHKRIKQDLSNGINVIYDATNIHYKRRKAFLGELKKIGCEKICVLMATPYERCLTLNKQRERNVPEHAIRRMYANFYIPARYEGWDDIKIVWNVNERNYDISTLYKELMDFDQDNPHHTLTLGNHLINCYIEISSIKGVSENLRMAAALHDIGKPFTKSRTNAKGEPTKHSHYYQHHLVSAYDALFYLKQAGFNDADILETCSYIMHHMRPYNPDGLSKFMQMVGQGFYNNLLILHKVDKKAH